MAKDGKSLLDYLRDFVKRLGISESRGSSKTEKVTKFGFSVCALRTFSRRIPSFGNRSHFLTLGVGNVPCLKVWVFEKWWTIPIHKEDLDKSPALFVEKELGQIRRKHAAERSEKTDEESSSDRRSEGPDFPAFLEFG